MSINYPMGFSAEQLATRLNEHNKANVSYWLLDWGLPTPAVGNTQNTVVLITAPDGIGEATGTQTAYYNRLDLGEIFTGVNPFITAPQGWTRFDLFRSLLQQYGLPSENYAETIEDPEATLTGPTVTFKITDKSWSYLEGELTVGIPFAPNDLRVLFPNQELTAWNVPGSALTTSAQPGKISAELFSYTNVLPADIGEMWTYFIETILQELGYEPELGAEQLVGLQLNADAFSLSPTLQDLFMLIFQYSSQSWKIEVDTPAAFNLYNAKIVQISKDEPVGAIPRGSVLENKQDPNKGYTLLSVELDSAQCTNMAGTLTAYLPIME